MNTVKFKMGIFQAKVEKTKDIDFMGDLCPKFVILSHLAFQENSFG